MNFLKKITQFFSDLLSKKEDLTSNEKAKSKSADLAEDKTSRFKNFIT